MATQRRFRFIYGLTAWMLLAVFVLTLLESVTLKLVFVLSFIGFLVTVELTAPFTLTPRWRHRLKWITGGGLLVFAIIVIRRILAILPAGVF